MRNGGPSPHRQGRLAHDAMGPRARVVPVIVVQGGADRVVRAGNGDRVVRQWLTTSALASEDAARLDFARPDTSMAGHSPGGLSYSVRCWNDDGGRPVVQYWSVPDLGHAWSGGASEGSYTDPRGPSATGAMCSFFAQTPMDRNPQVGPPPPVVARGRWVEVMGSVRERGRRMRPLRPTTAHLSGG
jgi:poly(3-hydroxybutyrate) depolymerase